MIDSRRSIERLIGEVSLRLRLASLLDHLVVAVSGAALVLGGLIFVSRITKPNLTAALSVALVLLIATGAL